MLFRSDERYYSLPVGSYLFCVSTTRNEPLDYQVGLVVEVQDLEPELLLETGGQNYFVYENAIDLANTLVIGPIFTSNYTLTPGFNGYTNVLSTVQSAATVTIPSGSTWFIDQDTVSATQDHFLLDLTENYTGEDQHTHSLSEWQQAWQREHQDTDRFPDLFIPYTTTS